MRTHKTDIQGFTLVEVLVALAIFSVLMVTLFSSFNAFTAASKRIMEYEQNAVGEGPGMAIIVEDLEQAVVFQPGHPITATVDQDNRRSQFSFLSTPDQTDGRSFSRLTFASMSPVQFRNLPGHPKGITVLTYYLYAHDDRVDLHRSDIPAYIWDVAVPDPCIDPVVFRDVLEFQVTFFDREGNEHDQWDSQDEDYEYTLPVRAVITITLEDGTQNRQRSTQVALPAAFIESHTR